MRRAWTIFIALLALSVAAELFVAHEGHFAIERLFAWSALYGFLACAALILVAKALGILLKRPDDYYD
jgi:hypothetical protein